MAQIKQEFLNSISEILPSHLSLEEFAHFNSQPLRPAIRVNTLKTDPASFIAAMTPKGWHFDPIPWCHEGFWLTREDESVQLGNTLEHLAGLFYIQEASSMMPPVALAALVDRVDTLLDMAAAPGSKTTQMAAWMENHGLLMANEYSSSRLKGLHANLTRMGVSNAILTHFDARVFGATLPEAFDAILLDAPCSGEGTLRKDPDALNNWSLASVESIAAMQRELIESGFQALKTGGVLIYSTCTLNRRENQEVCRHLKASHGDAVEYVDLSRLFDGADKAVTEEGFLHIWPQLYDSEGFFVAALRKVGPVAGEHRTPRLGRFPFVPAPGKQVQALTDHLKSRFGITLPRTTLMARDKELWLFPEGSDRFIPAIRMQRLGIRLAEEAKHGFRISHEALMLLGAEACKAVELDDDQAVTYLMGRDLPMDNGAKAKGEVLVRWRGTPLGQAKWVGNKLKNSLPRDLVRDNVAKI
ncbi:16S rRNA (cytosine(1407)-C(5))-methyltransferase RsmF [Ferrimonas sediminicola]|uniref:Ribosomal RNA small subunit methyltransferase F n=1 Tax=Ferrimonas sediminicola TaxID=2569538 RepID=A0A4U1BH99_9GAMM|nr:16S rRNA (cytosine(1407)-C(5))-methyltransferase RsmF [Ferrimonas sediminicola]TKB50407.1 16S rRNA (cytosine(1407)-C(5))-methyltransferase RsmF [Ferrimonas sediminicola]